MKAGQLRVIVLTTGRAGSVTMARACEHIANYTAAHESSGGQLAAARMEVLRRGHIEVDNRFTWILGRIGEAFADDPHTVFVDLHRDDEATARSYAKRFRIGRLAILGAYAHGILMHQKKYKKEDHLPLSHDLIGTIRANIRYFLRGIPDDRKMAIPLEDPLPAFREFWSWIGATGDLPAAEAQWRITHNASKP